MKKIGVITYFYYYNYGTMLQGYALRRAFDRLGKGNVKAEIIDCRYGEKKISKVELIKIRFRRLFVYFTQLRRIIKLAKYKDEQTYRRPAFDQFAKMNCCLSEKTYRCSEDLYGNPPQYDIYVTGSDQTWSPKIGLRDSLFLGFAPEGKVRVAYAPSIGVTTYTEEQSAYVKERLAKYKLVSCREKYGTEILNNISPVKVETVLDPTFMVYPQEWREIAVKPSFKGKYILCYFIGDRKYYRDFAKQLSKQLQLPLVYIPVSYMDFTHGDNMMWTAGPREFLGLIDNAEVVLTDSFHGSIFSINLNKNFYSFIKHAGLSAMDNMRILDILDRMSLRDRLQSEYKGGKIDYKEIDYTKTNELLAAERKISEAYLNKIIDSVK